MNLNPSSNIELVKFSMRVGIFFVEYFLWIFLGVSIIYLFEIINIDCGAYPFFITPLFGHFIFALFFKGRTIFMMLYRMEIISEENGLAVSVKILALRQILRVIYCIPVITLFWALIRNIKNPWYDQVLGIQMVWKSSKCELECCEDIEDE